jgi:hypothetical protein
MEEGVNKGLGMSPNHIKHHLEGLEETVREAVNADPEGQKKLIKWANKLYLLSGGGKFTVRGMAETMKSEPETLSAVLMNLVVFNNAVGTIDDQGVNWFQITSKKENIRAIIEEELESLKDREKFLRSRLDSLK